MPALDRAIKLPPAQYATVATGPAPLPRESTLTLTIVLNRDDPEGFGRFVREVQDPRSPNFRRFASQEELARRFGPTREAYDRVLAFLEGSGFALVEGSANRLTLTTRGTRAQGECALGVRIDDYRMHGRSFFANDRDPVGCPRRWLPTCKPSSGSRTWRDHGRTLRASGSSAMW